MARYFPVLDHARAVNTWVLKSVSIFLTSLLTSDHTNAVVFPLGIMASCSPSGLHCSMGQACRMLCPAKFSGDRRHSHMPLMALFPRWLALVPLNTYNLHCMMQDPRRAHVFMAYHTLWKPQANQNCPACASIPHLGCRLDLEHKQRQGCENAQCRRDSPVYRVLSCPQLEYDSAHFTIGLDLLSTPHSMFQQLPCDREV